MRENPGLKIEVVCHTDCKGTAEANQKLSEERARRIAAYLQQQVPNGKERITSRGMGEKVSKSGCYCEDYYRCLPSEYQIDRRTDFIIKAI
jgi:outer membrane protein OmpA-like peptidoglycan-associated protein